MRGRKNIQYEEGQKLGPYNLVYISETDPYISPYGKSLRRALFRCTCTKIFPCLIEAVKVGNTSTCGCGINSGRQRHGLTGTVIRRCWANMRRRCLSTKHKHYQDYGGRGIIIYAPWITDLIAFKEYVSTLPHYGEKGRSIDRIDNSGNYEPGNLRWATSSEQNKNRKR